jgi:hypothetical protein
MVEALSSNQHLNGGVSLIVSVALSLKISSEPGTQIYGNQSSTAPIRLLKR